MGQCCSNHNVITDFLKQTPLRNLSDGELDLIAPFFEVKTYEGDRTEAGPDGNSKFVRGDAIFTENVPDSGFFILVKGVVELTKNGRYLRKKTSTQYLQAAIPEKTKRQVTAIAKEDSTVLRLSHQSRETLILQYPEIKDRFLLLIGWDPVLHLGAVDVFQGLRPDILIQLSSLLNYTAKKQDEFIFREGSSDNSLYIVLEGRCKLVKEHSAEDSGNVPYVAPTS